MRVRAEDWRPRGIDDLEPAAWDALRAGTASVTAGPGAGKTEFLAQRASYLLETGQCRPPQQILAISFKRDAARNLRERIQDRVPSEADRFVSMTFDAFTKSIVDRFRGLLPPAWAMAADYRLGFTSGTEVKAFLDDLGAVAPDGLRADVYGIRSAAFLSDLVGAAPLPLEPTEPTTAKEYAVTQWWQQKYIAKSTSGPILDFVMLNRLAELLIRSSAHLRRALRITYPYVFVDEFQDATYSQYDFLRSVFPSSATVLTVVGDDKQRIMGWAGAHDDAFAQFTDDFGGEHFELEQNYRSNQELVDLQHRFAIRLNPAARPQASQVVSGTGMAPVQAWSFHTASREAETVAAWIAADIEQSERPPSQYALIARQKVADLEPTFARAFAAQGLSVRNDDALVGKVRLQDLVRDELAQLLIGLVRLGSTRGGQPETWRAVTSALARARPEETNRQIGTAVEDELSEFVRGLRSWFTLNPVTSEELTSSPSARTETATALTTKLAESAKLEDVAHKRLYGDRPEDLAERVAAVRLRLASVLGNVTAWDEVAAAFSDEKAVPLMTIHRSKGLEYHTVFFIGLDGEQWWAHRRDTVGSTMAFFVGVSRAAERLIFTSCDERGSTAPIADLYRVLEEAGVSRVRID